MVKIKYIGPRQFVSTVCGGRNIYYFGPENNKVCDVKERNITELLRTGRFITVTEAPKEEKPIKQEPPKAEKAKEKPEETKPKKKRRRRKKNVK